MISNISSQLNLNRRCKMAKIISKDKKVIGEVVEDLDEEDLEEED